MLPARVRAVVTDMDGTIIRPDRTISAATVSAARRLRAAGIPLILATARTPLGIGIVGPMLADVSVAVCCNGSIGYAPATQQVLWQNRLAPAVIRDIAGFLTAEVPAARLGAYDGHCWTVCDGFLELRTWRPVGPCLVTAAADVCQVSASALGICHPELGAPELRALIDASGVAAGRAALSYGADDTLDVSPPGTDKGAGVLRALSLASIAVAPGDAVGFGDSLNDLPMIAVLGRFIATANAHPAVLAAAHEITGSVTEDGVAAWLARMVIAV